jgi:hypothetical protein
MLPGSELRLLIAFRERYAGRNPDKSLEPERFRARSRKGLSTPPLTWQLRHFLISPPSSEMSI